MAGVLFGGSGLAIVAFVGVGLAIAAVRLFRSLAVLLSDLVEGDTGGESAAAEGITSFPVSVVGAAAFGAATAPAVVGAGAMATGPAVERSFTS